VGIHRDPAPLILLDSDGAVLDTLGFFPSMEISILSVAGNRLTGFVPFGKNSYFGLRGASVLVGTADAMEVREYDDEGNLVSIARVPGADLTVTDDDERWFEEHLSRRAKTPQEQQMLGPLLESLIYPETKAAYSGLLVDPSGNVWLRTGRHFPPEGPSPEWTVFSVDGAWLGSLEMPEGFDPLEVGEDYLLGVWRDELDVESVRVYGLERS
jgi:hypothetical protein